jgi:PIN like domain
MSKPKPEIAPDTESVLEQPKKRVATPPPGEDASGLGNPFLLEDTFPDAVDLLRSSLMPGAADSNVVVAIDTNALLLPYAIGKDDLGALGEAYKRLAREERLFLPARSAREFIKHRDRKIAELLKTITDLSSKMWVEGIVSPILEGLDGYEDLKKAGSHLAEGRKAYLKALDRIRTGVAAWRGNDPVTLLYAEVFTTANVIEHDGQRDALQREWADRSRNRIPPGYKDGHKEDTGIGDYLIWRTLLRIGREQKRDLVFVTGDEKADWFVRSGNRPVFARPELLVEYRGASDGKNLHLSSLAELLGQFGTEERIIEEVRSAEASANSAARMRTSVAHQSRSVRGGISELTSGEVSFDYSRNDGQMSIGSPLGRIDLRFSKASDTKIYLYRTPGLIAIMHLQGALRDVVLDIDEFDASSGVVSLTRGEAFAALNTLGEVLIGRILGLTDYTRGASGDQLHLEYRIFQSGMPLTPP